MSESSTAAKPSSSVGNHTLVNLNESTTKVKSSTPELQIPVIPKPKVKKHSSKTSTETKTSNGIVKENEKVGFDEITPKTEVKTNKYKDVAYIEGKTSTFNPATRNVSSHQNNKAPKSILKAKSSSELKIHNSTESENHLTSLHNINNIGLNTDNAIVDRRDQPISNETLSTKTVKYSKSTRTTSGSVVSQVSTHLQKSDSTYTNDEVSISMSVSQAKVGLSQTKGIGNTSNVATSLFFDDDDDDDYEDNEEANRRSVEC